MKNIMVIKIMAIIFVASFFAHSNGMEKAAKQIVIKTDVSLSDDEKVAIGREHNMDATDNIRMKNLFGRELPKKGFLYLVKSADFVVTDAITKAILQEKSHWSTAAPKPIQSILCQGKTGDDFEMCQYNCVFPFSLEENFVRSLVVQPFIHTFSENITIEVGLDKASKQRIERELQGSGWQAKLAAAFVLVGSAAWLYQKYAGNASIVPRGLADWLSNNYARLRGTISPLIEQYLYRQQ